MCLSRFGARVIALALWTVASINAQVFLTADGQTDTYTLINQTLGGTAEETPDRSHPDFGRHITLQFDSSATSRLRFIFMSHRITTGASVDLL